MSTEHHTLPRVTIAVPLYRRLEYLADCLASVADQDYGNLELLVSDNGENGPELKEVVARSYPRPFAFRRNESTVPMSRHFNQLIESASGEYFVLLCDDDRIAPGFVSRLVEALESDPEIGIAIPRVELIGADGNPLSEAELEHVPYVDPDRKGEAPPVMSGEDFVRGWVNGEYRFKTFITVMARTEEMLATGGYPVMATGDDDAVALRLTLGRKAAYCESAVFWNRAHLASEGLAMSVWELASDIRTWLRFLDSDPCLKRFAAENRDAWPEIRRLMREKAWRTYRHRWKTMYRDRLSTGAWLRAGFALPFIPGYYRWLSRYLLKQGLAGTKRQLLGGRS